MFIADFSGAEHATPSGSNTSRSMFSINVGPLRGLLIRNEAGQEFRFNEEQWLDSAQTLFLMYGDPLYMQLVSQVDLLPADLLTHEKNAYEWQKSITLPDEPGALEVYYVPPVGNSVLLDRVEYGPGRIEAGNESVIEANVDLPGREQVEYIEKTVMNAIGTANTPTQSLEVLGFAQVSAGIAEGSVTIGVGTGTSSAGSGVTKPPAGIGRYLGYKRYELTNHLGNVLTTISDFRKTSFTGTTINYFKPDVRSVSDHYPFGMLMPGRQVNPTEYLYGFNGKEEDDEVKGTGNQQDYGLRIYDPRIAKFLSIDPRNPEFPMLTPYQFGSNCPISGIDLDGLEYLDSDVAMLEFKYGGLQIKLENFSSSSKSNWNRLHRDPKNWEDHEIGLNRTLFKIKLYQAPSPEMKDIPGEELPASAKGVEPSNRPTGNRIGVGRTEPKPAPYRSKPATFTKGMTMIDGINLALEQYLMYSVASDMKKVEEHYLYVNMAIRNLDDALAIDGLIPQKYRNNNDLTNILNVVLQGVNNSIDPGIYELGLKIYKLSNPDLPALDYSVPFDVSDATSTKYTLPKPIND